MVDESKGFIRGSMILLVTSTMAAAINYVFQFGMGRLLGPADYGILATFYSILYIMSAPTQAVQLTITKFIAEFKAQNQFSEIKDLLFRSTKKIFLLSVAVFLIFAVLSPQISKFLNISQTSITIAFSFVFLGLFILPGARGFLQGMQKFKALGLSMITESTIKLVLSLILVFAGFSVAGAVWGTNISLFLAFIIVVLLMFRLLKKYEITSLDNEKKSEIYKYAIPMLVALSSITALYSIDVILVKHFFVAEEAGIYAAASLIAKIIFFGLMPISNAMFPKIAELKAKSQGYGNVFIKSIAIVTGLSALATAVYYLAPGFVDKLLFGPEYAATVPLIGLFGAAISLLSISYVFVNYFLAIGKTRFVYMLPVFAVVETALIWFWHASLWQILILITAVMSALLISLMALNFTNKYGKTLHSNSSI